MKQLLLLLGLIISQFMFSQRFNIDTLLTDKISIRAIEIDNDKVWYAGTDSKFGYVNVKNSNDKNQIKLSSGNLQFRTIGRSNNSIFTINIESPANFFKIDKNSLNYTIVKVDSSKSVFYDALHFVNPKFGLAFSDPDENRMMKLTALFPSKNGYGPLVFDKQLFQFKLLEGEAAFAASNTNIDSFKEWVWIVTGGAVSRVVRINLMYGTFEVFPTSIVHGTSSQGIYSVDFYDENFGIVVGGDYTKQADNVDNIATTQDGGKTWQIQASGKNAGYTTCVKFRPKSKGKELISVGDQHISFSADYGVTWTKISNEKNLYACEWLNSKTVILAGKNRIIKLTFL